MVRVSIWIIKEIIGGEVFCIYDGTSTITYYIGELIMIENEFMMRLRLLCALPTVHVKITLRGSDAVVMVISLQFTLEWQPSMNVQ